MVYIQSDSERRMPHHFDAACALYGAMDNGATVRLTTLEEVNAGKFDSLIRNNLFAGSTTFMLEVFKRAGIQVPSLVNDAHELPRIIKLSEAINLLNRGERWFIKPVQVKLFSGMVFDNSSLNSLSVYPDNTEVVLYTPFVEPILSETRCYIHHGKIADARNYSGDFRIMPDFDFVENMANQNIRKHFPVAYTIDVAVMAGKSNRVVEFQDMWAIGNYGLENDLYYRMLFDRYFEIINRHH